MRHQCRYFLTDSEGVRRCSQCNQPAQARGTIETKTEGEQKQPKYIFPPDPPRTKKVARQGKAKQGKKR